MLAWLEGRVMLELVNHTDITQPKPKFRTLRNE
jgi:hypothetical protein